MAGPSAGPHRKERRARPLIHRGPSWFTWPGPPRRVRDSYEAVTGAVRPNSDALAGGTTHAFANPGTNVTAVLLQYES